MDLNIESRRWSSGRRKLRVKILSQRANNLSSLEPPQMDKMDISRDEVRDEG